MNDDWKQARGILPDTGIPAEYEIGLARGKLGEWIQEVHDAGCTIAIVPVGRVVIRCGIDGPTFADDDTDIERAFARSYIQWREREGERVEPVEPR